eukprot:jgi/Mesvir1/19710/Mv09970-RA.1
MADGFNPFLIVIICVISVLTLLINIYIIIEFQHPEDVNQAWFPKFVVLVGLTIAILSILMLPLDVANREACNDSIVLSACNYTLPMKLLWFIMYITNGVLVAFIIPFTMFYYEADQDLSTRKRVWSGIVWCVAIALCLGMVFGLAYGLGGEVEYPVNRLVSGTVPLTKSLATLNMRFPCISSDGTGSFAGVECDAEQTNNIKDWKMWTSFPVYVIAVSSIIGWLLFMFFAGVGIVALPFDWITAFFRRPRKIITRTDYIHRAGQIFEASSHIHDLANQLKREAKAGNKGRKWRKNVTKLAQELVLLEQEEEELVAVFPQGEKADVSWALTVLSYLFKLIGGILGLIMSILWFVHIVLFIFFDPPLTPFLNDVFVKLDDVFGLFGTSAFALFCFWLMLCTIKGNMKLGLRLLIFTVHPMKVGGTMMSSFLFNVGMILLCSISLVQFCAQAFELYAKETAVDEIFGDEIEHLKGLKYLYKYNVFIYIFMGMAFFSFIFLLAKKDPKRRRKETGRRAIRLEK